MSKPRRETNIQIPDNLIMQLLTSSEIRMLKNRFQIINLLKKDLSIRNIAKQVKVGTDTVVRVARMIEGKSVGKVLNSVLTNKPPRKFKTNTPWIFGKSDN